jgi:hypothetical protein
VLVMVSGLLVEVKYRLALAVLIVTPLLMVCSRQTIRHRRDAELALAAVRLGNRHPSHLVDCCKPPKLIEKT